MAFPSSLLSRVVSLHRMYQKFYKFVLNYFIVKEKKKKKHKGGDTGCTYIAFVRYIYIFKNLDARSFHLIAAIVGWERERDAPKRDSSPIRRLLISLSSPLSCSARFLEVNGPLTEWSTSPAVLKSNEKLLTLHFFETVSVSDCEVVSRLFQERLKIAYNDDNCY